MRIALINGSPKVNHSASKSLSEDLLHYMKGKGEAFLVDLHTKVIKGEMKELLITADIWVLLCPLYVDGLPSHILSTLIELEDIKQYNSNLMVYGVVNCGFYEGEQNELALKIIENWCIKAEVTYGGGIGIGGGGGLAMMPRIEGGHGPRGPIDRELIKLVHNIFIKKTQKNVYVSVAFPRRLYKLVAQFAWRQTIKSNGGKSKDLGKRPEK